VAANLADRMLCETAAEMGVNVRVREEEEKDTVTLTVFMCV